MRQSVYLNREKYGFDYPYENCAPKKFCSNNPIPSQVNDRRITSNRQDIILPDNSISTCKYNLLTFLPKNLFIQYCKIANIYFLLLGVLQLIPSISNSNGQPTIWLPLFLINIATALKDLYEDLKRRKSDNEENNGQCIKLDQLSETKVTWQSLRVGNIIKVEKNQFFPCDVLLLDTSEPKGVCYIETKNLDGETNLKQKNVQEDILKAQANKKYTENYFVFEYERPNPYLYNFNGRVFLPNGQQVSINANNFVLRGCSLRNTRWVVCLVAYTGHDTKIMMNSFASRPKQSILERQMSFQIILIFILMVVICIFGAAFYTITLNKKITELDYLQLESQNSFLTFIIQFFSWILILSNLIPISLLVTLEMVKVIQGIIIIGDDEMIYKATMTPTVVQSSNLNEELGQIQYLFSDKTGTLTCNIMEFKRICINGISYGETKKGQQQHIEDISELPKVTNVDFRDKNIFDILSDQSHNEHQKVLKMIIVLALCHTIIVEKQGADLIYNASSPDELALINFAKFVGISFLGLNESNIMDIKYNKKTYQYQLIHILEFNSTRKRMSVILKDLNCKPNKIILFTKGADSIILERIQQPITKQEQQVVDQTIQNLSIYGNIGLRTLLIAERQLDNKLFQQWNTKYMEACSSLEKRDEKMEQLQEEIEVQLQIVGATAIEDKLQDKVGETIDSFLKAGIKVWVLTGDKIETAINIAYSCRLLNSDTERILIDSKEEGALIDSLEAACIKINNLSSKKQIALIISGDALHHGLKGTIAQKIMIIAARCKAILCCRVSPKQKQEVVSLVRRECPDAATLAIGDGANDVNMITAAHVGIGIKGLEGAQAARASDYAIGEFKLLRRLMFYHGRECYRRNSNLILFNFFKNILIVLPQFWLGVQNQFSGPTIYDNYTFQLFNVFFAALPIMVYAIFDREFHPRDLQLNYQNFYEDGLKSKYFNVKVFWGMFFNATCQSVIITFFSEFAVASSFVNQDGYNLTYWSVGAVIFGLVVIISNMKVLIISNDYSISSIFLITSSIIFYFLCFLIVTSILYNGGYLSNEFQQIFLSPNVYLGNILVLGFTTAMDLAIEWHSRWKMNAKRKIDYIERLQQDIVAEEEDIVFVKKSVNSSQTQNSLTMQKSIRQYFQQKNDSTKPQQIIGLPNGRQLLINQNYQINEIQLKESRKNIQDYQTSQTLQQFQRSNQNQLPQNQIIHKNQPPPGIYDYYQQNDQFKQTSQRNRDYQTQTSIGYQEYEMTRQENFMKKSQRNNPNQQYYY